MPYGISSRDYLKRARSCLDLDTPESLFYAAFELRAGIQARMQEYLQAQDHVADRKKEDWQLGKLARSVEETFQLGDQIGELSICDRDSGEVIEVCYYTPVTTQLRANGERLGELLHASQTAKANSDPWWPETRRFLETIYGQLELANTGTLLGPLLREARSNKAVMRSEILSDEDAERLRAKLKPGFSGVLNVRYLDKLPPKP